MFYFLVYRDGNDADFGYLPHINKLLNSVREHGKQFQIVEFHKKDIEPEFSENNRTILSLERGGGYWLWKPYIINKFMEKMQEGDVVFYLDSLYWFFEDFRELYEEHFKTRDLLVWKNKPNELVYYMKNWCKMDVILKYDMYNKVFNENAEDCWGGAIIVKKTDNSVKYMKEWLDMCCIYDNITDSPSVNANSPLFREHRHDQSLLAIVLHKYNIPLERFENRFLDSVRHPYSGK